MTMMMLMNLRNEKRETTNQGQGQGEGNQQQNEWERATKQPLSDGTVGGESHHHHHRHASRPTNDDGLAPSTMELFPKTGETGLTWTLRRGMWSSVAVPAAARPGRRTPQSWRSGCGFCRGDPSCTIFPGGFPPPRWVPSRKVERCYVFTFAGTIWKMFSTMYSR